MIKRLIDLDRKAFYKLCVRFKLHPYEAACWAWVKGLAMGLLIGLLFL